MNNDQDCRLPFIYVSPLYNHYLLDFTLSVSQAYGNTAHEQLIPNQSQFEGLFNGPQTRINVSKI